MLFGIDSLYFWLAVIIISVAVEAFTLDLCAIWFAAGGVAALVAASCGAGATPQLLLFAVLSAVMLLLLRPLSQNRRTADQRRPHYRSDRRGQRAD